MRKRLTGEPTQEIIVQLSKDVDYVEVDTEAGHCVRLNQNTSIQAIPATWLRCAGRDQIGIRI